MATTAATYHKPQPALTQSRRSIMTVPEFAEFSALARDLEELCAAGFIEAYRDEHNVVRYRPVERIS